MESLDDEIMGYKKMLENTDYLSKFVNALKENSNVLNGKTVLNLKAGTGWLAALCANLGAAKVYAVESNHSFIPLAESTIEKNNCSSIVKILNEDIDELTLEEEVDIIISEWLFINPLEDIDITKLLSARKFLKQDGVIIPESCDLFLALCQFPQRLDIWNDVCGVKMTEAGLRYRHQCRNKLQEVSLQEDNVISKPECFASFALDKLTKEELEKIEKIVICVSSLDSKMDGLCLWTEVNVLGNTISSSPLLSQNNKQGAIIFPDSYEIDQDEPFCFNLSLCKHMFERYAIYFEVVEPTDVEHPEGCSCHFTKCLVLKACLQSPAFNSN